MVIRLLLSIGMLLASFGSFAEEEGEGSSPTAQYVELSPSFVANFGGGSASKLRYIKTEISLRVPSEEAASQVRANNPLVRHEIVMLLSAQTSEQIAEPNSQELIRAKALEAVRAAMKEETGAPQVDDLLFTSFVVQG